jgi:hypothetical protein
MPESPSGSPFRERGQDVLGEEADLRTHFLDRVGYEQQCREVVDAGIGVCRDFRAHLVGRADEVRAR